MTDVRLDEIRAAVARCTVTEDGATLEARQQQNSQRKRVFKKLDEYSQELEQQQQKLAKNGGGSGEDAARIEVVQRELEDLASTLVLKPVQPESWLLFQAIDVVWRVPAVMIFLVFMGFVVSIPLIMLTMVEQQLFLARNRRRASRPVGTTNGGGSGTTRSNGAGSGPGSTISKTAQVEPASASVDGEEEASAAGKVPTSPFSDERSGGEGSSGLGLEGNSGGLSSILIRMDCAWLLLLMGIHVRADGLNERSLARPAMLLFTHVSTLDAVVILGTVPRALCAVVKEELLAVPVLGWIMASRGAIPINRDHRASAVQALEEAAERARELEMFLAMAPEGTRTKTGQLGPFKKGALHMQEQLQCPVIPVTIRGAYELFPLKWNVNQCGKVVVKYHKPIEASEIKSREGLSRRLRQEMLDALDKDVPEAGTPLDPSRRLASVAATAATYWAAARAGRACLAFSRREGVALWALVVGAIAYVFLSTVFVFFVYARKCFSGPRGGRGAGRRGATETAVDGGVKGGGGHKGGDGAIGSDDGDDDGVGDDATEVSGLLGGVGKSRGMGGSVSDRMKDR